MTDHEAEIATLHQEATQQRARIKRLEAENKAWREFGSGVQAFIEGLSPNGKGGNGLWVSDVYRMLHLARDASQESSQ